MKQLLKWTAIAAAAIAAMFMTVSCVKSEKFLDQSFLETQGVYGIIDQVLSDDEPFSKASVNPDGWKFSFEVGDHINIWSEEGTLVIYTVKRLTSGGGAQFDGGGFALTDGMKYYSSFPLLKSFTTDNTTVPVSYEGQVQTVDGESNHVAPFSYTYSSSTCTSGSAAFAYHFACRWLRFNLTLPQNNMTLTELKIKADSPVFALNGTMNIQYDGTTGTVFTPGTVSDTMVLELDDLVVTDGVLNANMAVAPFTACNVVVSVKDADGIVYESQVIAQDAAVTLGKYRTITTTVADPSAYGVAKIGSTYYDTIAAAVDAVPADGTATTITILQDVELVETSATSSGRVGINIPASKNVILDLNGHTISHVGLFTGYSRLIENQGVLTLMDSSDTDCNGTGTGKLIVDSREPGTNTANYYSSDVIANQGFLTILSGLYEMNYGRLSSYVLFNDFTACASLSGGKLYQNISTGRVVQMNLSSSSEEECSTLEISGTAVLEGRIAVYMDSSNGTYHVAVLSISGGALNSTGAAVYCSGGNVSHISVDITGGVFGGTGLALNAGNAYYELNVSGGHFADFIVGQKGGTKFVSGGEFESIDHFWDWRFPSESVIADGYKVVYDSSDRLYKVVAGSDSRPDANPYPENQIYYRWGSAGSICYFYAPFDGNDNLVLEDGEFVDLVEDITLTKDVYWIEESDWTTPISQGGTFGLTFGEFDIDLNGYKFPLPAGVSCKTDRQTTIFSAPEGCTVVETEITDGDYHYQYSVEAIPPGGNEGVGGGIDD